MLHQKRRPFPYPDPLEISTRGRGISRAERLLIDDITDQITQVAADHGVQAMQVFSNIPSDSVLSIRRMQEEEQRRQAGETPE